MAGFYGVRALWDPAQLAFVEGLSAVAMAFVFVLIRLKLPLLAPFHRVFGVVGLLIFVFASIAPTTLHFGLSYVQWLALVVLLTSVAGEAWWDLHQN
jgi:hypothetical protein